MPFTTKYNVRRAQKKAPKIATGYVRNIHAIFLTGQYRTVYMFHIIERLPYLSQKRHSRDVLGIFFYLHHSNLL